MELLRLWLICLTEATHKEHQQLVGQQMVILQPGQFVTGRFDLAAMYNGGLSDEQQISPLTAWRWLQKLERYEFLNINSNNKFSVVSILNWDIYQKPEQQNEQQLNNKRTTTEQQLNTNNNDNNKNIKRSSRQKRVFDDDSVELIISRYLFDKIRTINPGAKEPNFQKWADHVRLMIEQDKRTVDEIREVLKWLYTETEGFWRTVILSTDNLRSKFDAINTKRLNKVTTRNGAPNIVHLETVKNSEEEERELQTLFQRQAASRNMERNTTTRRASGDDTF
jgi:hypothetical protein